MKNQNDIAVYLNQHGIKKTAFRVELLDLFFSNSSLTQEEIKEQIKETKNKVTIYRALEAFEKKGIIHKVPDINNVMRYALCQVGCCSEEAHTHNHIHFICKSCKSTYCIEEVKIPNINLPEGYQKEGVRLTVEGVCPRC
ncbi:MAG: transcriptional repressor [Cytophagales bacterium]|nr:transcriptional repressor [Cytophagales bacterium]